jgi:hypothetical protein
MFSVFNDSIPLQDFKKIQNLNSVFNKFDGIFRTGFHTPLAHYAIFWTGYNCFLCSINLLDIKNFCWANFVAGKSPTTLVVIDYWMHLSSVQIVITEFFIHIFRIKQLSSHVVSRLIGVTENQRTFRSGICRFLLSFNIIHRRSKPNLTSVHSNDS